jgi:hypothetical protein
MAHIEWNDGDETIHLGEVSGFEITNPAADDQFANFAEAAGWPTPAEVTFSGTFTLPDDSPLWRLPVAMAANKANN